VDTTSGIFVAVPVDLGSAARSEVRVNGIVMRYRRLGSGKALVALALEPEILRHVVAQAARTHRVLVPETPLPADDLTASWLREFMDGLGLTRVAIIADETFGIAALELAMIDHDRIASLVVVSPGADEAGALAGSLTGPVTETRVRVLLVRATPETADAVAGEIVAFLETPVKRPGH